MAKKRSRTLAQGPFGQPQRPGANPPPPGGAVIVKHPIPQTSSEWWELLRPRLKGLINLYRRHYDKSFRDKEFEDMMERLEKEYERRLHPPYGEAGYT